MKSNKNKTIDLPFRGVRPPTENLEEVVDVVSHSLRLILGELLSESRLKDDDRLLEPSRHEVVDGVRLLYDATDGDRRLDTDGDLRDSFLDGTDGEPFRDEDTEGDLLLDLEDSYRPRSSSLSLLSLASL